MKPVSGRVSKQWKVFEREIAKMFGGKRVPLSGSNSGHKTSADVMWPEKHELDPTDVYIECKRNKVYNTILDKWYDRLIAGSVLVLKEHEHDLAKIYLFDIRRIAPQYKEPVAYFEVCHGIHAVGQTVISKLYRECMGKAQLEGKDYVWLAMKLHCRQGIFFACDFNSFVRLKKYYTAVRALSALKVTDPSAYTKIIKTKGV